MITNAILKRKSLFGGVALSAIALSAFAAPAYAQVAPADAAQEEATPTEDVIVTGSLIRNPNLEASTPVNVVTEKEIELQQANVAEELLRELPGAVPSIGSAVNNGNGGASFVNLRNLGSNRNVVLLDGVRLVPAELQGRFDLNNIPLALVQRVDVQTGGASTTYGADAVAGVVNFITRSDFAGLDASMSQQITEEGDGNVFRADVTIGANFDGGRGNAVLSVGYQEADAVYQGARDYGRFAVSSTTGAGGGSGTAVPSRFSLPDPDGTGPILGGTFQVNPGGTAFNTGTAFTAFNFNPFNVYQTPFKRHNIYGSARYEISDAIEIYTRGIFSKNSVETIIAPSGAFGIAVAIPLNNPFLNASLRNSFCVANGISAADCLTASNPALTPTSAGYRTVTSSLFRRATEVGPRISRYDTTFFDYRLGFRGALTSSIDWDLFGSYGESENLQTIQGYTLNSRVRDSLLANNTTSCFTGTATGCVPVNFFGPEGNASFTPAAIDFLNENSTVKVGTTLAQARALVSGDFGMTIPMSSNPISFAVGGEFRRYTAQQSSDSLAKGGDLGGAGGAAPDIRGEFDVKEAFGELIVPLIQNKPFFQDVTIEAGVRYSSYKIDATPARSFDTTTWKVGGSWTPVEGVKVRGNYARAVRAPNIAELFNPQNTGLTNLNDDPCAVFNDSGTRVRANPTGTTRAICLAQGATAANVDSIAQPISGQANATGGGNLNLTPEKSTSWTVGAVVQPIRGVSLSVDYFNITVKQAVSSPTPGDAIAACFGSSGTPAAGAEATLACTQIRRDPLTGGLNGDPATTRGLFLSSSNLGYLKTSGVDFTANFQRDLGAIGLDLNFVLTWVDESKFQATPTSIVRECIGYYSANCMPPQPEWQWTQRTTLNVGPADISLSWRHIGRLAYEGQASDFAVRGFTATNRNLFSGALAPSTGALAGRNVNFNQIGARDYFDLTARVGVNDNLSLIFGVQNLLDKEPPLVGGEAGSTTFNSGNTFPSTYDALGRRFVATAKVRF